MRTKSYIPKLIMRSFYIEQIQYDYKTKGIEKFIPEEILDKSVWMANQLNQVFANAGLYPSNFHINFNQIGVNADTLTGKWFDLMKLYPDGLLSRITYQNMINTNNWKNAKIEKLNLAISEFNKRYKKVKQL